MQIREVQAKTILSKSGIADYCINPYMGCGFGCVYCYAQLIIRKFHPGEAWGSYVDVKINAPQLLEKEIVHAKHGVVMLSSVTDPYHPVEKKYELTRRCLEILLKHGFPITILTRSPLVTRDIDLLQKFSECNVGVSITTNDDKIKKIFEPLTPNFKIRVDTLKQMHDAGLRTYAFIGPMLPMNPGVVAESVAPYVDYVFIDKLNYPQLWKKVAQENSIDVSKESFERTRDEMLEMLKEKGVKVNALF
ncbi:MAG: radical SAM protein [Candidatus Aenigmarchaeota archaeon]|nr:radical SAM protein [Candidatus Aenigmarchaeota archaeon]